MLRHPALQDLSRDHQLFLLNCRHIRWLADGDHRAIPFEDTLAGFVQFWDDVGALHVREEEEIFMPRYAATGEHAQAQVQQLAADHAWLRAEIALLRAQPDAARLIVIGARLHDHVRYEEREAFEAAQKTMDAAQLEALWAASMSFREQHRGAQAIGARSGITCVVPKRRGLKPSGPPRSR